MRDVLRLIGAAIAASLLACAPARAEVVVDVATERVALGPALAFAHDPQADWSIEDAASAAYADRYAIDGKQAPHFGFEGGARWAKTTLRNASSRPIDGVVLLRFPYLETVDFFVREEDGWRRERRGHNEAHAANALRSNYHAFAVEIPANGAVEVFLRVETGTMRMFPSEFMARAAFETATLREQLLFAALFGAIMAVVIYAACIGASLKDSVYLHFAAFSTASAAHVAVASGMAKLWFWPHLALPSTTAFYAVQGLMFGAGALFFQRFLKTRKAAPIIHHSLTALAACGFLGAIASWLPQPVRMPIIALSAAPGPVLIMVLCLCAAMRGVAQARIAAIGWSLSCFASVFLYLRMFDITPYLPINHYLMSLGCGFASMYFACAIAWQLKERQERLFQLERLSLSKDRYFAGVAHELRTPLNAIINLSGLLDDGRARGAGETPNAARLINEAGGHMLRMVNQILDFSKIAEGKYALYREAADVGELARDAVNLLDVLARNGEITLTLRIAPETPVVSVDRHAVTQMLINLVSNAIKFTEPKGVVSVVVEPGLKGGARLVVEDTGIGIAEADLKRILAPYEQAETGGGLARLGTGLGLSIVKSLTDLHGGTLKITSAPGRGTRVEIDLPATTADAPRARAAQPVTATAPSPAATGGLDGPCLSVLGVDDVETNRLVLKLLLANEPCRLTLAEDGAQAVAAFSETPFDLVLLDIEMPGMNGFETLAALRAAENRLGRARTPIYALTAHVATDETAARFAAAGFAGALEKPVDIEKLRALLSERAAVATAA